MFGAKLKTKILALALTGILFVGLIASYGFYLLSGKIAVYDGLMQNEVSATTHTDALNLNFKRQVQEWKNVLLRGHEQKSRDKYWQRFLDLHDKIQQDSQALQQLDISADLKAEVTKFRQVHQALLPRYKDGFDHFVLTGFDHIGGDQRVRGIDREPTKLLEALSEKLHGNTLSFSQQAKNVTEQTVWWLMSGLFFALMLAGSVMSFYMSHKVVKPILELITKLKAVSDGDYSFQKSLRLGGEIGEMSDAIEVLRKKLDGISLQVTEAETELETVSDSLLNSANAIAIGVDRQNSATKEAECRMDELNTMATDMTKVTSEAHNITQVMASTVRNSNKQLQQTVDLIGQSSDRIRQTSALATDLQNRSSKVENIIQVIEAVAEKTNLLALNAAIEAARAGEQGRGFAVVADEVRQLAAQTGESTAEIKTVIEGMLAQVDEVNQCVEDSLAQAALSSDQIMQSEVHMLDVNTSVESIANLTNRIKDAAVRQGNICAEVMSEMNNISSIAGDNAEFAQNCQYDNQILSEVTGKMDEAIKQLNPQGKIAVDKDNLSEGDIDTLLQGVEPSPALA